MISICLILFFMNCFHLMTFDLNLLFANYSLTVEIYTVLFIMLYKIILTPHYVILL